MTKIEQFANTVVEKRVWIIALTTLLVLFFGYFLKDLAIDGSSKIWFGKDSTILADYEEFTQRYGSDEGVIIAFRTPAGVFNQKDMKTLRTLHDALEGSIYFANVTSLLNFPHIFLDKEQGDEIMIEPFLPSVEGLTPQVLHELGKSALSMEGMVDVLVSRDGTTTLIAAKTLPQYNFDIEASMAITHFVREILAPFEAQGYVFHVMGAPIINESFVDIATRDGVLFTSLSITTVLLLLWVMFRSKLGSFLPMIAVLMTVIVVLSIQTLLGYKLNSFTANLPVFVVAIGIVHAVHVYWVWADYSAQGHTSKEAAIFTIEKNFVPVFLTSFTTAIGFASLGISEVIPIRTLGFATGSAAMLAFVMSIAFVPAVLTFFTHKRGEMAGYSFINPKTFTHFIVRHDMKIILFSIVVFVVSIVGLMRVEVDNNGLKQFKSDHPIRTSIDFMAQHMSAPMPFEVVVDSGSDDGVKDAAFLAKVDAFSHAYREAFTEVANVNSLVPILKRLNQMMHAGDETFYSLPQKSDEIAQYLLLYSFSMPLSNHIDATSRHLRLTAATHNTNTSRQLEMIAWAKAWWQSQGYEANVYGQPAMFAYMQPEITQTLIYSIGTAFLLIAFIMALILRDIRNLGFFLLPNIFPIITSIGVMGWLDIYVDMGVAISAAIVLGIAVDDAIHFMIKYLEHRKKGHTFEESMEHVMRYTGGAIVLTTLILSVSFLELVGSSFLPNVYFAVTTVSALLVALLADLFLLPALFSLKAKKDRKLGVQA
ncbi:MAG: hypothetical protein KU37_07565 [Sulfuricurvum sp. PC08-66]|nr:MAG: hypothetical protein KU37_07565 [Sulfuricurvum sp. PC08-66]